MNFTEVPDIKAYRVAVWGSRNEALNKRNTSIWAHGLDPVDGADAKRLHDLLAEYGWSCIPELEEII